MRTVAHMYIDNHMPDLLKMPGAKKIHSKMQAGTLAESIRKHVDSRVEEHYPESDFPMPDGAVPEKLITLVQEQEDQGSNKGSSMSAFSFTQATMADASSTSYHDIFSTKRPSMILGEAAVERHFLKTHRLSTP